MASPELDLLVVGSGVAGLSAAARAAALAPGIRVGVVAKAELEASATQWAQGGVAAVLSQHPGAGDSVDLHLADTLAAGADLCDAEAVRLLVSEAAERVGDLIDLGARFDTDPDGAFALAREGGHSTARVVHAGGTATGAEIERALVTAVRRSATALWEGWFALDLVIEGGRCRGAVALNPDGEKVTLRAAHTLLATGGVGQLFSLTTNPLGSTGGGLAMALRAGVACADVEFVQFHPTALAQPAMPRPLLSEALRGEGALLRDVHGARFVDELAPRDVVSAALSARMLEQGADHLWLDATGISAFASRFPNLADVLSAIGLDPAVDLLPVAPAAHHHCGGVLTDLDGATSLPGLWAAGEVACTGVHGANRLASNSLLEGMVFGPRVVEAVVRGKEGPTATGAITPLVAGWPAGYAKPERAALGLRFLTPVAAEARGSAGGGRQLAADVAKRRELLQRAMFSGAGVLRSASSLGGVADQVEALGRYGGGDAPAECEMADMLTVARALLGAAAAREESRGAHRRSDFPERSGAQRVRWVVQ